jgi:RNA polymerase sigma-70 factor (ECF subfamily)
MADGSDTVHELDTSLARAAMAGSLSAFDALVDRYRRAAVLTAYRVVRSWDVAEEVAQDAFVLAFRRLRMLRDPSGFAAWVRAITRHRALRVAAAERRSEPAEPDVIERQLVAHSRALAFRPDDEMEGRERLARAVAVLNGLPEIYGDPLLLFHGEHWPVRQIAAYLALPEATVRWRLHQGRKLAAARLLEREENDNDRPNR